MSASSLAAEGRHLAASSQARVILTSEFAESARAPGQRAAHAHSHAASSVTTRPGREGDFGPKSFY